MKRIALLLAMTLMGTTLFAQDNDQKKNDDEVKRSSEKTEM